MTPIEQALEVMTKAGYENFRARKIPDAPSWEALDPVERHRMKESHLHHIQALADAGLLKAAA